MSNKRTQLSSPGGDPACGCCRGLEAATPAALANRPGLTALAYRAGTHGTFLETMLARLAGLPGLKTRSSDDLSIALLDVWASLAEVLTFYQERLANEGYLRTAVERRSLLELARLVGYAPRPGVAASVHLAFTVGDNYETVAIPAGTRAQSVPEVSGEMPQFFETGADIVARPAWNDLGVRLSRPQIFQVPAPDTSPLLYLEGTSTNLVANGALCVPEHGAVYRVLKVEADQEAKRTAVEIEPWRRVAVAAVEEMAPSPPGREEILAAAEPFRDLDAHGVRSGATAGRVLDTLKTLREELAPESTVADRRRRLVAALEKIVAERTLAHDSGWGKLAEWTDGLAAALREKRDALFTETIDEEPRASTAKILTGVLDSLAKAPSRQPANAQRLERDPERLFGAAAQMQLDLLTHFTPRARPMLYAAWENATVAPPPPVNEVGALRVQAAPFGATAPRRPVFDRQGGVIGEREWPLASYHIHLSKLWPNSFEIDVTRDGGETFSTAVTVEPQASDQVIMVGGLQVIVTTEDHNGDGAFNKITLTFGFLSPPRSVVLTPNGRTLTVEIAGAETKTLLPGSHVRFAVGGDRVFASWSSDLGADLTLEQQRPPENLYVLALDAQYDQILPETCVAVERADGVLITRAESVRTVNKAAYGITGKVTELTLAHPHPWLYADDRTLAAVRDTVVYAGAEPLALAPAPIDPVGEPVAGDEIHLDGLYPGLEPGRWLIVSGERVDVAGGATGVEASELAMISEVAQGTEEDLPGDTVHTVIGLAEELAYSFKRDTVTLHANVVPATHGETREQILGSGDGSRAGQSFSLAAQPLTHVAAPTPAGAASTLEVRVDDVLWQEAENPASLGADERAYTTLTDNDDVTTVVFGDGKRGARLPTGVENVEAEYRQGIGPAGNVAAKQISLLATQPLGVEGVINPLPATGGADRDAAAAIRRNAPLQVMALDRLVSVRDYADFARTFAGIAKADAQLLSDGRRRLVHLTVAGVADAPLGEKSALLRNLRAALASSGDPHQPFTVAIRELLLLVISARLRVRSGYLFEKVESAVRQALLETFSFARRDLGQDVALSEVISAIQGVAGVAAVDVDVLHAVDEKVTPAELEKLAEDFALAQRVRAELGRVVARHVVQRHGESLSSIAARYGLDVRELRQLNRARVDHWIILVFLASSLGFPSVGALLEVQPRLRDFMTAASRLFAETEITSVAELLAEYPKLLDRAKLEPGLAQLITALRIPRTLLPAQLIHLSPDLPDTLILKEWTP